MQVEQVTQVAEMKSMNQSRLVCDDIASAEAPFKIALRNMPYDILAVDWFMGLYEAGAATDNMNPVSLDRRRGVIVFHSSSLFVMLNIGLMISENVLLSVSTRYGYGTNSSSPNSDNPVLNIGTNQFRGLLREND